LDIAVIAILSVPRFVPNALLVRPGRPAAGLARLRVYCPPGLKIPERAPWRQPKWVMWAPQRHG
jgi:hypothetical protein